MEQVAIESLLSARSEMIKDQEIALWRGDKVSVGQTQGSFPGRGPKMQPKNGRDAEQKKDEVLVRGDEL